eukprot:366012-Chlamydomonas_euryale.AAC.11
MLQTCVRGSLAGRRTPHGIACTGCKTSGRATSGVKAPTECMLPRQAVFDTHRPRLPVGLSARPACVELSAMQKRVAKKLVSKNGRRPSFHDPCSHVHHRGS